MKKLLAVYGTLKRANKLYPYYLEGKSEYVGNSKIKGTMQLVSVGSYPYLFKKGDREYDIEIFNVNIDSFDELSIMECSAGYYEEEIDTPFGKAVIFYTENQFYDETKIIEDKF